MSAFKPVHLPEPLGDRGSQTFLRHYSLCPRSGYLYALTRGQVRTADMMRGAAGHAILERATKHALEEGEAFLPGEVVKVIVDEVLADPAFPVPFEEHDYLREASYRWAAETAVDGEAVVAAETLYVLDVNSFKVRCKVDFAEVLEDGAVVHVVDYKTGRGAVPFDEVARKLPDGRLSAKSFQLVLYGLALVFGVPVRIEPCGECSGLGMKSGESPGQSDERVSVSLPHVRLRRTPSPEQSPCDACGGSGRIEIPEPFPVAGRAQRLDLEFVYPGIEDRDGKMVRRPVTLSRAELDQYRGSLAGLVERVRHAERTGDWPAVVSDDACDQCPASGLCPIPAELRDHRGAINTAQEAADALQVRHREQDVARAKSRELRKVIERLGSVRFGNGMVAELEYSEHEEIFDKEGLFDAFERSMRSGEPLERGRFVRTKGSTRLKTRALTAEELAESEGSNGSEGSEGEAGLDRRFGADAPW